MSHVSELEDTNFTSQEAIKKDRKLHPLENVLEQRYARHDVQNGLVEDKYKA